MLYWQNSPSPGIYCVESGSVRVFQILDNGMESILNNVVGRTMVGEVSALNGEITSPAAIALTDVRAYLLPTETVRELIAANPGFAQFVVDSLVHKLRILTDQFGAVSGKKVLCRLATILCMLDSYGVPCTQDRWFTITHAELAGLISTTRPNVTALLNRLADQGLIELRRNMVRILDKDGLAQLGEYEG
jgi:CRP/FNR family transcriptional regulator